MMLSWLVGFTAIDVSLCGVFSSQEVLTLAAFDVAVVQIGTPLRTPPGGLPNPAVVTGAAATTPLCVKSIGCVRSSSSALAAGAARNEATSRAEASTASGPPGRRRDED